MHTLGLGSTRISGGLGRISDVFGGAAEIQGWSPVRVPPRAQCFRRSVAVLVLFHVDSVHTLASVLKFRGVWCPRIDLFGCGRAAAYGGPGTALWGLFWVLILVVLPLEIRVHHFMVARAAHNMTCRLFFRSAEGCGRSGRSALMPVHAGTRGNGMTWPLIRN